MNKKPITGKERILKTLRFEEPDRPPHFEVMFELEEEAFGLKFPDRNLWWDSPPPKALKERMIAACMEIYAQIVETFQWDALLVYWPWCDPDGIRAAKKIFGESILIGGVIGNTTWSIEGMHDWEQFAEDLVERPEKIHEIAEAKAKATFDSIDILTDAGADFIHMVNDIAFNGGTFISPDKVREFVIPYLAREVRRIRDRGAIPFIHTDGNIMSILDDYIATGAACYQSVDPMAGMDIDEVKKRCYGKMTLMGNVQCNLLQDGPDEKIIQSAKYCLDHGAPGGGYIYGSSNTIFPGMPLRNYRLMVDYMHDRFKIGSQNHE
jgi:uroporphyrinogen decarboxylase